MFLHALMLGQIRTNGLRLHQEQFPAVYDKVKELCVKMGMKFVPDVYVMESSGALYAFATRFFGRNMVVLYSTVFEMIEEGAEDELSFVIAHELAHIKRRHLSKQLFILPALWFPGVAQAYSRACEYTCDRMAAFYIGNSEAAKNCLTMFGIGKQMSKYVNRTSYINQSNEERGFFIWLSEVLSTHPPLPKRIREIAWSMGDDEAVRHNARSLPKKAWIGISAAFVLLAGIIGGSIYTFAQLDPAALISQLKASAIAQSTTPLIDAVIEGDTQKVNNLLQEKENINLTDSTGWTALHWAVQASDVETCKMLLDADADPNIANDDNVTPLMTAAAGGNSAIVQMLLRTDADINHQDLDGWTSLMYAVSSEQTDAVRLLLKAGANTNIKDAAGTTALMQSIQQGSHEITALFRSHQ